MVKEKRKNDVYKIVFLSILTVLTVFIKTKLENSFSESAIAAWIQNNTLENVKSEDVEDAVLVFFDKSNIWDERNESQTLV